MRCLTTCQIFIQIAERYRMLVTVAVAHPRSSAAEIRRRQRRTVRTRAIAIPASRLHICRHLHLRSFVRYCSGRFHYCNRRRLCVVIVIIIIVVILIIRIIRAIRIIGIRRRPASLLRVHRSARARTMDAKS